MLVNFQVRLTRIGATPPPPTSSPHIAVPGHSWGRSADARGASRRSPWKWSSRLTRNCTRRQRGATRPSRAVTMKTCTGFAGSLECEANTWSAAKLSQQWIRQKNVVGLFSKEMKSFWNDFSIKFFEVFFQHSFQIYFSLFVFSRSFGNKHKK